MADDRNYIGEVAGRWNRRPLAGTRGAGGCLGRTPDIGVPFRNWVPGPRLVNDRRRPAPRRSLAGGRRPEGTWMT